MGATGVLMLIVPVPVFHRPTPPTTYPPVTKKLLKNLNASDA